MNPMLTNLNSHGIKQMVSQIKAMGNPQMMLQQMPQYRQAMEYINANGGDPKTAFYKLAQERGVDPNEILRQLNS